MSKDLKHWLWTSLTLLVLFGMGAGLWVATKKVDYNWHWNRVPQYFFYYNETVENAPFDAHVENIKTAGKRSTITIVSDSGETENLVVATESVAVDIDEDLFEGDHIGANFEWKIGPLTNGLIVTLWISAAASFFG